MFTVWRVYSSIYKLQHKFRNVWFSIEITTQIQICLVFYTNYNTIQICLVFYTNYNTNSEMSGFLYKLQHKFILCLVFQILPFVLCGLINILYTMSNFI